MTNKDKQIIPDLPINQIECQECGNYTHKALGYHKDLPLILLLCESCGSMQWLNLTTIE